MLKRGQGLPLNLIVIAAIAVLVLVLVVAFATGAIGKLFGGARIISEAATPDEIAAFKIGCEQSCFSAQQLSDTDTEFIKSGYCNKTIPVNETGTIVKKHCWQDPVDSGCTKVITNPAGGSWNCKGEGEVCICPTS